MHPWKIATCGRNVYPFISQKMMMSAPEDEAISSTVTFIIKTAPKNAKQRQLMRKTWSSVGVLRETRFIPFFVSGVVDVKTKDILAEENDIYGDILFCDNLRETVINGTSTTVKVTCYPIIMLHIFSQVLGKQDFQS